MIHRTLKYNPITKTSVVGHIDHYEGTGVITHHQEIKDIVELNKAQYNATDERSRWNEGQVVARIPLTLMMDLHAEGILLDEDRFADWLDDSDNRVFRTRPGKIGRRSVAR